ncbi:hypothetical protein KIPB_006696 [Kipferlia bialata]|uniref:Spindle assembly abnormal protein 6 N-terminal domain-containing protein n=1 Tax=Kipferlia bialata TaxID=797122 RepID=A0A9K3GJY3_9EUKA|nr:hypothetical protein KIPB_006696 [Kipferlia bialata]|eukprot:g6696.t1
MSYDMADPSLEDGSRVVFEREVVMELRKLDEPDAPGIQESVRARILIQERDGVLENCQLCLTSEEDIFFMFKCDVDQTGFQGLQETQKLMIGFNDLPGALANMLTACIKDPRTYLCVLFVSHEGVARLEFIQGMVYKYVELMSLNLVAASEDTVRQYISFRYKAMTARCSMLESNIKELKGLIKVKLPSLHMQLSKQGVM